MTFSAVILKNTLGILLNWTMDIAQREQILHFEIKLVLHYQIHQVFLLMDS